MVQNTTRCDGRQDADEAGSQGPGVGRTESSIGSVSCLRPSVPRPVLLAAPKELTCMSGETAGHVATAYRSYTMGGALPIQVLAAA